MPTDTRAVANDAAVAYYADPISKNMGRTPQGYLICKDAVIGRTGQMRYAVRELARKHLEDLGIADQYRRDEVVDVWRDADEVFSPSTLASFEDMPVTDEHPSVFVTAKNHAKFQRGHVRNVRAGQVPLASGDLPILADLVITDERLAEEVLSGRRRELSCGYNYHLAYDGQRLSQVGITGNHVALVARGRAGAEARITDAASSRKEYPVTRDRLISLGIAALAKDASTAPEEIAAAARAAYSEPAAATDSSKQMEAKDAEIADLKAKLQQATDALKAKDEAKKDDEDEDDKDKMKGEDAELAEKLAALDEEDDEETMDDDEKDEAKDADFIAPIGEPGTVDLRTQLRELRPLVARSKDAALHKRFNKLAAKVNDSQKGSTPGDAYAQARKAASTKSAAAQDSANDAVARMNARAQKNFSEVK